VAAPSAAQSGGPLHLDWHWRVLQVVFVSVLALARWRIDVEGAEHLPSEGGAVIVFNHHSYADAVMLAWAIVMRGGRPVRFMAKREACEGRWLGWLTRWVSVIPVDRGSTTARARALEGAVDAVAAGDLVAIAPEQTISDSLELLPFRRGAARVALTTGAPIVPCVGWGSQRFVGPGRRPSRPFVLPVTVRFSAPIVPLPGEDAAALTARLRARMESELDHVQRTYPGGTPAGAPWVPARLGGGAPPHDAVLREHAERQRDWDGGRPR
jgi:1-acyl-sn-glycerol-3-phosphate acyltransferase